MIEVHINCRNINYIYSYYQVTEHNYDIINQHMIKVPKYFTSVKSYKLKFKPDTKDYSVSKNFKDDKSFISLLYSITDFTASYEDSDLLDSNCMWFAIINKTVVYGKYNDKYLNIYLDNVNLNHNYIKEEIPTINKVAYTDIEIIHIN